MSATKGGSHNPAMAEEGLVGRFLRATEIDTRMLGMLAALFLIWAGFDLYGLFFKPGDGLLGGQFLTPRNLWTLLVQTSSIAVMATGMVLIIVMRQIDLSVGSVLTTIAVAIGALQVYKLGPMLGVGHPSIWIVAVIAGLLLGALIGALNGALTAYAAIPSFIVTLGGLIAYRGIAFLLASGVTIAPMDNTFVLIGGYGPSGSIGPMWSWILGLVACAGIVLGILRGRQQRKKFGFPLRPVWAEVTLAAIGSAMALGITAVVNAYPWAPKVIENYAKDHNIAIPPGTLDVSGPALCMDGDKVVRCVDGLVFYNGYAIPVLIAIVVGLIMTFIANRTRFGRYVYAAGGNPEAVELAGINSRKLTVLVFTLMGILVGVSAIISSARLNAATIALGQSNELYVIAAVVIGGTSLAGGIGTIYGAMLGALLMQSLQSGMSLLNFDSAYQDIVVGVVLALAVYLDQVYRRRAK